MRCLRLKLPQKCRRKTQSESRRDARGSAAAEQPERLGGVLRSVQHGSNLKGRSGIQVLSVCCVLMMGVGKDRKTGSYTAMNVH